MAPASVNLESPDKEHFLVSLNGDDLSGNNNVATPRGGRLGLGLQSHIDDISFNLDTRHLLLVCSNHAGKGMGSAISRTGGVGC